MCEYQQNTCTAVNMQNLMYNMHLNHCKLLFHCTGKGAKTKLYAGRPGSSEVPRNPLTRWDMSSIQANGIFLTKKLKNYIKNAQRMEND